MFYHCIKHVFGVIKFFNVIIYFVELFGIVEYVFGVMAEFFGGVEHVLGTWASPLKPTSLSLIDLKPLNRMPLT